MSNIELIHFIKWKGFAVKRMKKTSKTKIKRLLFFVDIFFFIEPTYFDIWTHLIRIHSAAGRCCAYREKWISCLNIQTESGSANVWNKLDAAFCIYTHTHTRTPSHKILSIKERKEEKKNGEEKQYNEYDSQWRYYYRYRLAHGLSYETYIHESLSICWWTAWIVNLIRPFLQHRDLLQRPCQTYCWCVFT